MEMSTMTVEIEDNSARRVPGEAGVWLLIFGDMMVFSIFFVAFVYSRAHSLDSFSVSQTHLHQTRGLLNTVFMLTSSWFVAMATRAARRDLGKVTPVCLMLGFACGAGFVVVKFFE